MKFYTKLARLSEATLPQWNTSECQALFFFLFFLSFFFFFFFFFFAAGFKMYMKAKWCVLKLLQEGEGWGDKASRGSIFPKIAHNLIDE